MAVKHEADDNYMLQVKLNGNWHDVQKVRLAGGSNMCRTSAKHSGNTHRIINRSKQNAVYCEIDPR